MKPLFNLVLTCAAGAILMACGGEGARDPVPAMSPTTTPTSVVEATVTPEAASPTASAQVDPTTPPTTTPEPPSASGAVGDAAVVDPFDMVGRMYSDCPAGDEDECWDRIVQEAGVAQEAIDFWLEYELFLVRFEEHGDVDYGEVVSPRFNMGRPEPVFLNGEPELVHLGEVVPADWRTEPGYADLPEFANGFVEYAGLVDVEMLDGRQAFILEMPIMECRACQPLGYLNVEIQFLDGVLIERLAHPMTPSPVASP